MSPRTLSPIGQSKRVITPKSVSIPETDYRRKLNHLSTLAGLTCFESEFVARLRAKLEISDRELAVLSFIWDRHGQRGQK